MTPSPLSHRSALAPALEGRDLQVVGVVSDLPRRTPAGLRFRFALDSASLMPYAASIPVNLIISGLFIVGGIGFTVLIDLKKHRRWQQLSVNIRLILLGRIIAHDLVAFDVVFLAVLFGFCTKHC